ncbi:alpha/beta hydrolase, partial [Citrobacter sp. AAK_AS5]
GFDPLHDEGVAYAEKLQAAGVPVTLVRHNALPHAWVTMVGVVPPARAAMDEPCALVRKALHA